MSEDERETLRAAIQTTEYKYFGDYELSLNERVAIDTLVAFAERALTPPPPAGADDGIA